MSTTTDRRIAIVTGGARGIGAGICRRLAADGLHVVVAYGHAAEQAERLTDELRSADLLATAMRADMGETASVRSLFAETQRLLGRVDVVVCNAGIGTELPLIDYPEELFDETVRVNLKGTFLCLQEAGRRVESGGAVVAVSSGYTRRIGAGAGPYTATKAGIEALVHAAALEFAPRRVTVNTVIPSLIESDGITPEVRERIQPIIDSVPLGGLGSPADVAGMVSFLVGEDARWITGKEFVVDGGLT